MISRDSANSGKATPSLSGLLRDVSWYVYETAFGGLCLIITGAVVGAAIAVGVNSYEAVARKTNHATHDARLTPAEAKVIEAYR